jgi:hypothetical protein
LTGGLRWDLQKAENAASTAEANPLFPEILPDLVYDGAGTKISWSDISPRVGFTYALNDSHKTQLRGNFSIFTQQLANRMSRRSTRSAASPGGLPMGRRQQQQPDRRRERGRHRGRGVESRRSPRSRRSTRSTPTTGLRVTSSCSAESITSSRPTSRWA